jgi:hypothetical protein
MKTSSADDVELKSREDLNRQKCERKKTWLVQGTNEGTESGNIYEYSMIRVWSMMIIHNNYQGTTEEYDKKKVLVQLNNWILWMVIHISTSVITRAWIFALLWRGHCPEQWFWQLRPQVHGALYRYYI